MRLHQTSASLIREFTLHGLMADKMTSYSQRNHIFRAIGLGNGSHCFHLWGTQNCKREKRQHRLRCDRKCWLEGSWTIGEAHVAGGSFPCVYLTLMAKFHRERELHSVEVIADDDTARVNQASFSRETHLSCFSLASLQRTWRETRKKNNAAH